MKKEISLLEVMLLGSSIPHLMKSGAGVREEIYYDKLDEHLSVKLFQYYPSKTIDRASGLAPSRNKWVNSTIGIFRHLKYFKSESVDIVRSKQLWGSWAGSILSTFLRKPHILRCGYIWSRSFSIERGLGGIFEWMVRKVEIFIFKRADGYIFCSQDIEDFYKPFTGNKPYIVLPNYVDKNYFYPEPLKEKLNEFLYLGRFIELKGAGKASKYVNKLGLSNKSTFIGKGPLHEAIKASGVNIIPCIPNDKLRALMASHKFFISFSKTEGSPKALLEAIFSGLVPILSDIPVHREIIKKLGYGLIIKEDAELKLNSPMCNVNYKKLSSFMDDFSLENHITKEINFFKNILNGNSK